MKFVVGQLVRRAKTASIVRHSSASGVYTIKRVQSEGMYVAPYVCTLCSKVHSYQYFSTEYMVPGNKYDILAEVASEPV